MVGQHILIVEGDRRTRQYYQTLFSRIGRQRSLEFLIVPTGPQALAVLGQEGAVDLMILEWMLPELSGREVLRAVRADPLRKDTPVLIVAEARAPGELVEALEAGADDFLSKPINEREFLARLRSLCRRSLRSYEEVKPLECGDLRLDCVSRVVTAGGEARSLRPLEVCLLEVFMRRPGRVLGPRLLWAEVWGSCSEGWEHTLSNAICRLRASLGGEWAERFQFIKGGGYIFYP